MIPRWLIRPIVPAFIFWMLGLLALFLVVDLSIMPAFAGKFRGTVRVPSVIGLEVEQAEDTLRAYGLRFSADTLAEYSRVVPRGRILAQRPDSGSIVKDGRRIWATLSLGRARNVRGR